MSAARESFAIFNARIVTGDAVVTGSLAWAGDTISRVDEGVSGVPGAFDFEGDFLLPGLIELHTDNLEKHLRPRPNVHWPAFAALQAHDALIAGAGITTVFDAVALGDRDGKEERLQYLGAAMDAIRTGAASGLLRCEHFVHLRCEVPKPHVLDLYYRYADDPLVRIVSLMDHTPGDRQFVDLAKYKQSCITHFGESANEFDRRVALEQENQLRYARVNREALAREARARGQVLASHDDASLAHIEDARALGAGVSEFPTTVAAARAAVAAGLATIAGAPNVIRGGSHSGNAAARDLADAGCLDILSSDYMPISLAAAPFRLRDELGWPLPRAVAAVTKTPAETAGLSDRGVIAPGRRADFVRIRETRDGPFVREVWRAGTRVS